MSLDYIEANRLGLERLEGFISVVSDQELAQPVGDSWTVGGILAHIAFWDFRVLELLNRWKVTGIGPSPVDVDIINDSAKPLCLAIPGQAAAILAQSAANAVDEELENLPEDLLADIQVLVQQGKFWLDRSLHRNEHLDQIESVLDK